MAVNKVKEVAQPSTKRPVIITVANLKKQFGSNRVLRDIDVEIYEGEVVVVVGSSGSGKSTFLRCLNLLFCHQSKLAFETSPCHVLRYH